MKQVLSLNIGPLEDIKDLDPLMEDIGDARIVTIGEASHGTHEYYTWRMKLSRRLIDEKGFRFIAVEGDWPDCYRVNRYVKHYQESGKTAFEVLNTFNRWPIWMWANWEMVAFADWLAKYNHRKPKDKMVGFYGLDIYSLYESMEAIIKYLEYSDPDALPAALDVLNCFNRYGRDEGLSYARSARLVPKQCEAEVKELLKLIRSRLEVYDGDPENVFSLEQNALIGYNAERYYKVMLSSGPESWNLRDKHMYETLMRLMGFHGPESKCIVWEHNTHIGDARATDMKEDGMLNIGQLLAELNAEDGVYSIGQGSYEGSVLAGRKWGDVTRRMHVPEAENGSWESMLHEVSHGEDSLILFDRLRDESSLDVPVGHRAIGVVYQPEYEKFGNYVSSVMPRRYDAFMYFDRSNALSPLKVNAQPNQMPETYPFGF